MKQIIVNFKKRDDHNSYQIAGEIEKDPTKKV
jgi:hypothetical protein